MAGAVDHECGLYELIAFRQSACSRCLGGRDASPPLTHHGMVLPAKCLLCSAASPPTRGRKLLLDFSD